MSVYNDPVWPPQGEPSRHRWEWHLLLAFSASLMFSTALVQIAAAALILLWIWRSCKKRTLLLSASPLRFPLIALLLARLASIPLSVDTSRSIEILWIELPFYFVFFALVEMFASGERKHLLLLLWVCIGAGLAASVVGSVKFATGVSERAASTTSGYYTLGMYLTVILSLVLPFGRKTSLFRSRWLWAGSLAVLGVGILLTLNRIHWGIAGLMVGIMGVWKERWLLALAIAGGLTAVIAVPGVGERFGELLSFTTQTTGRDLLWKGALDLAGDRPLLGFGPRTFPVIFPYLDLMPDRGVGTWHNDFVQIYMESGIAGLASYVWLLAAAIILSVRAIRIHTADPLLGPLSIGLLLALCSIILSGLVGGFFTDPLISLLFRLILALIAVLSLPTKLSEAPSVAS